MTQRDVLALAMKITGVAWIVTTLDSGVYSVASLFLAPVLHEESYAAFWRAQGWLSALSVGVGLWLGCFLVWQADALARRLIRVDGPVVLPDWQSSERPLLGVAVRVIGIAFVVFSLPALTWAVRDVVQHSPSASQWAGQAAQLQPYSRWWSLARPAVVLLTGAYLFLGAPGLVRFLLRADAPVAARPAEEEE